MKLSRTLPAALPGAVLALGVTACSSDDSDDNNTGKSTGTATESASWPVTVEHTLGSSTIEEKPERIVVLHEAGIDPVLSLGLGPVAMFEIQGGDESMPWLEGKIDWPTDGPAWQPILDGVAEATGLQDKAAEVKEKYNDRIAEIQEEFPGIDGLTYNSAMLNQGQLVYSTNSMFEDLGMVQTDAQKAAGARGTVSLERLDELDGDVLVIYDPASEKKQLEDNAQFAALPSVKNGSLIWQDMALGYAVTTASGPMSPDWAVEHITPELTAAVK